MTGNDFVFFKSQIQVLNAPYQDLSQFNSQEWLLFGADNLYPQHLNQLLASCEHESILKTKVDYTVGSGLGFSATDHVRQEYFNNINDEYDIDELLKRTAEDYIMYGGFAWELRYSYDNSRIARIAHQPFANVRVKNPYKNEMRVDGYYISNQWVHASIGGRDIAFIPRNDYKAAERDVTVPYLMYYANYSPIIEYYPIADYHGGIEYMLTDIELSKHHRLAVNNAFSPSLVMSMPFKPDTKEQIEELEQRVKSKYIGTNNVGQVMLLFTDADETGRMPEIHQISQQNMADIYTNLQNLTTQKIITAHRLTSPTLAGLSGSGGLGGNANEITVSRDDFMDTIIKPSYQNPILKELKKILAYNRMNTDVWFKPLKDNITYLDPSMLSQIMSINEMRTQSGLPPIKDGDQTLEFLPIDYK